MSMPGMEMLRGAIDSHVHCCPHINGRTVTVFDAVREAAKAGLGGIGLMDVFANSSGLAALAMKELDDLGVEVFGGIILEPYVGGISTRVVEAALDMGYGPGTGARFVSLPCHHTRFVAQSEGRDPAYVATCLAIPLKGVLPDPLGEIMERVADKDVVFNTGHLTGEECIRVVEEAAKRGVRQILCPASYFTTDEAREVVGLGAFVEFAFFVMSHATQVGTTMIDSEKHCFSPVTLASVVEKIRAVGPEHTVLSSDSGSFILPPPVEALREWLLMIESEDFSRDDIRRMVAENPAMLFKVGAMAAAPPAAG